MTAAQPGGQPVVLSAQDAAFVRQAGDRHDAVGPGLVQPDEQAEAGDAADPAAESRPDPLGQIGGGEAIDRFALGL